MKLRNKENEKMRKTNHNIEYAAEQFLKEHNPTNQIPVPIEEIIEFNLKIQIVPIKGLFNRESIDGFVSHDCTQLYIDEDNYMQQNNRARFTLAHEVGHIIMHRKIIRGIHTMEEWRKFVLGAGTGRAIYETEANIFAGCVLMPQDETLRAFEAAKEKISKVFAEQKIPIPKERKIIAYVAVEIAKIFDVSEQSANIRLDNIVK